ncbi:MAG: FAD-linked oxidase C-terminal domain-containing protein [Pigmentiphaga sp.]|uniref:FAD-binding oxidoreductase n=1 Tax=Pigmentiphaga sp. TaxID=1977564 RepID=UPI0029A741FE|nr:FAD-linked oxidase C-terminal domain-containing protein [Pigmentiphaga sp.]MDX3906720.1 FAD-linked oxidase C-terminal domain-containing protein [Pigmentiphaga sp.]
MNAPALPTSLRRAVPQACLDALAAHFGDRLSLSAAVREHHGRDESPFPAAPPDAVVFAESTEDVVAAVNACAAHGVPLIPYGSGSSLEGHLLAVQGGITLDLSKMNRVVSVNTDDLTATVQAGVTRKQLNNDIRDTGLFFPIDPGADASFGGMAATRASGTNAVRYGTMRDNILSLTVVTAQGKLIRTARRAKKSSAGYDLTRLFIGSEGTLGIITEVTVRLYPQPEAVSAAVCNFPSVDAAVAAVIQTIQMGIPVARVELLDDATVRAVNRYSKLTLRETPLLLFEFHGSPAGVEEQATLVQEITREHGGMDFDWAVHPEDRNRLWAARHNVYFATLQLRPGARASSTDVCVPISRLADCIRQTNEDLARASFPSCVVGHVGDGNFHVQMLLDPDSEAEWAEAEAINRRMVRRALDMDGTCTGEHGVGLHKMQFMDDEHGEDALELMRQIKQVFDPLNILNPGKVLPQASPPSP